jgi:hypothetical protein
MKSNWPQDVLDFEAFLLSEGLACRKREESENFGNKFVEYSNAEFGARVVCDRGQWYADVCDSKALPKQWYDAAIIRDLLLGPGEDVLPFSEQLQIIERNWDAIRNCFDLEGTHAKLASLKQERVKRRFK